MNVRQNLSVLFFLKRSKKTKEGKIPIYTRITVDGLMAELSLGYKVFLDDWNPKFRLAKSTNANWKQINKKSHSPRPILKDTLNFVRLKTALLQLKWLNGLIALPFPAVRPDQKNLKT